MAVRTTPNPLDNYVTTKPSNWSMDFKLPPMPSLRQSLSGNNVLDGAVAHDQANEQWRVNAEQSISERIREAVAAVTPAATTTTTTVASTPPASAPSGPSTGFVVSVNGKTGVVTLKSDDIPEGVINFYLTQMRWLAFFDAFGFHVNDIPIGASVYIPSGRNLVMTGPLSVEGSLRVDGYLTQV